MRPFKIFVYTLLFVSFIFALPMGNADQVQAQEQRQNALEDVFKQTLDNLFNKKNQNNNKQRQRVEKTPQNKAEIQLTFAPLVRQVAPSVVNVYAARKVVARRSPFQGDPFFEQFFGRRGFGGRPKERIEKSLGSGVIVESNGTIITNYHVIKGADEVKVALSDGSEYDADIILKDKKSDLAVLKIRDDIVLPAIEVGNSESVQVGDLVLAIGNPFGVGQTVTSGIVSALARSQQDINDFGFFIQTDAAINPGNSGGALIDMKGRLIGINTAIYSRSGGSNGIGFAVPSNMANVVLRTANLGKNKVSRPWLGADFQQVTSQIAESLGMRRPGGVLVTGVHSGGLASQIGLKAGDVVIAINKNIIKGMDGLAYRLDTIGVGGKAQLVIISNGKRRVIDTVLAAPPESTPRNETLLDPKAVLGGAVIANISPAVAQELNLSHVSSGVVVLEIRKPSRAASNGVKKGDVIDEINGTTIKSVADIVKITSKRARGGWQVRLLRNGRGITFERNGNFFRQYVR